jgi:hypothetical protein
MSARARARDATFRLTVIGLAAAAAVCCAALISAL